MVRQIDGQREIADRVLHSAFSVQHSDWILNVSNPNFVDRDVAMIVAVLHVDEDLSCVRIHLFHEIFCPTASGQSPLREFPRIGSIGEATVNWEPMSAALNYLTVQDHLWINFQVCRKKNRWNFAKLEEATYLQYGYGGSTDVPKQALSYARGFAVKAPFDSGNVATGFVGLIGFLELNGYSVALNDDQARGWYERLKNAGSSSLEDLVAVLTPHDEQDHDLEPSEVLESILKRFPNSITSLAQEDVLVVS